MKTPTPERRDWTLLIFIIPLAIILMFVAGGIAIQTNPNWSRTAEMSSKLDPNLAPKRQTGPVQPIGLGILTPYDDNLTPNPDEEAVVFPAFVVIEPNSTPSATSSPEPTASPTTPVTASPSPTTVITATTTATKGPTSVSTLPPATATRTATTTATATIMPTATITAIMTTTATRTATITATGTVTSTSTATPTNISSATPTLTPTATPTFTNTPTVTPLPTYTLPVGIDIGLPDDQHTTGYPPYGSFIILDFGSNPIIVNGPSDKNYDFVYYEWANPDRVFMDDVILSISSNGIDFYPVFYWGDNIPDNNSNIATSTETGNKEIFTPLYGPYNSGILIDVDNSYLKPSPPKGSYQYLKIEVPSTAIEGADIDAVEVIEVSP